MSHKFKLNQLVRLTRRVFVDRNAGAGEVYSITRLMPADETGQFSYHIRATGAGERAVRESDLAACTSER